MSSYDGYDSRHRRRRPLYAPSASTRRSTLGFWIPLVLTVTVATAGVVAWIWSEREEAEDGEGYSSDEQEKPPRSTSVGPPSDSHDAPSYDASSRAKGSDMLQDDGTLQAPMSGAVRRSASPQHFLDSAGQALAAGMAAAGAAVGGAWGSIRDDNARSGPRSRREEKEDGFSDHERWSEEAVSQRGQVQGAAGTSRRDTGKSRPRKTVAVVVSAENMSVPARQEEDAAYQTEHASMLSHLPHHLDTSTIRLFVLIYSPHLTSLANVSQPPNAIYDALHDQALALVERPSMILPFTTPTGYVHLLRHLAPNHVYIADTAALAGDKGANIAQLRGWVGQTVVVVGDEGHGGLADTETEDEGTENVTSKAQGWWEESEMVGLGKGVDIVDAGRVGDDWEQRLKGRD